MPFARRPLFLVDGERLSSQEVDPRQIRGPDPCRRGRQISDGIILVSIVMIIFPRPVRLTTDESHRKNCYMASTQDANSLERRMLVK